MCKPKTFSKIIFFEKAFLQKNSERKAFLKPLEEPKLLVDSVIKFQSSWIAYYPKIELWAHRIRLLELDL